MDVVSSKGGERMGNSREDDDDDELVGWDDEDDEYDADNHKTQNIPRGDSKVLSAASPTENCWDGAFSEKGDGHSKQEDSASAVEASGSNASFKLAQSSNTSMEQQFSQASPLPLISQAPSTPSTLKQSASSRIEGPGVTSPSADTIANCDISRRPESGSEEADTSGRPSALSSGNVTGEKAGSFTGSGESIATPLVPVVEDKYDIGSVTSGQCHSHSVGHSHIPPVDLMGARETQENMAHEGIRALTNFLHESHKASAGKGDPSQSSIVDLDCIRRRHIMGNARCIDLQQNVLHGDSSVTIINQKMGNADARGSRCPSISRITNYGVEDRIGNDRGGSSLEDAIADGRGCNSHEGAIGDDHGGIGVADGSTKEGSVSDGFSLFRGALGHAVKSYVSQAAITLSEAIEQTSRSVTLFAPQELHCVYSPFIWVMDYPHEDCINSLGTYLDARFPSSYMILNMSERVYDVTSHFISGNVVDVSFRGLPAPPLEMALSLCHSVHAWLTLEEKNALVVHCYRGYSRSILFLALYMAWCGWHPHPLEALNFVCHRMGLNPNCPLQILPSQRRFISYFDAVLHGFTPLDQPVQIERILLNGVPICEHITHESSVFDQNHTSNIESPEKSMRLRDFDGGGHGVATEAKSDNAPANQLSLAGLIAASSAVSGDEYRLQSQDEGTKDSVKSVEVDGGEKVSGLSATVSVNDVQGVGQQDVIEENSINEAENNRVSQCIPTKDERIRRDTCERNNFSVPTFRPIVEVWHKGTLVYTSDPSKREEIMKKTSIMRKTFWEKYTAMSSIAVNASAGAERKFADSINGETDDEIKNGVENDESCRWYYASDASIGFSLASCPPIHGETLIRILHWSSKGKKTPVVRAAFHADFCQAGCLHLFKDDLDGASSDRRFPDDCSLTIVMSSPVKPRTVTDATNQPRTVSPSVAGEVRDASFCANPETFIPEDPAPIKRKDEAFSNTCSTENTLENLPVTSSPSPSSPSCILFKDRAVASQLFYSRARDQAMKAQEEMSRRREEILLDERKRQAQVQEEERERQRLAQQLLVSGTNAFNNAVASLKQESFLSSFFSLSEGEREKRDKTSEKRLDPAGESHPGSRGNAEAESMEDVELGKIKVSSASSTSSLTVPSLSSCDGTLSNIAAAEDTEKDGRIHKQMCPSDGRVPRSVAGWYPFDGRESEGPSALAVAAAAAAAAEQGASVPPLWVDDLSIADATIVSSASVPSSVSINNQEKPRGEFLQLRSHLSTDINGASGIKNDDAAYGRVRGGVSRSPFSLMGCDSISDASLWEKNPGIFSSDPDRSSYSFSPAASVTASSISSPVESSLKSVSKSFAVADTVSIKSPEPPPILARANELEQHGPTCSLLYPSSSSSSSSSLNPTSITSGGKSQDRGHNSGLQPADPVVGRFERSAETSTQTVASSDGESRDDESSFFHVPTSCDNKTSASVNDGKSSQFAKGPSCLSSSGSPFLIKGRIPGSENDGGLLSECPASMTSPSPTHPVGGVRDTTGGEGCPTLARVAADFMDDDIVSGGGNEVPVLCEWQPQTADDHFFKEENERT